MSNKLQESNQKMKNVLTEMYLGKIETVRLNNKTNKPSSLKQEIIIIAIIITKKFIGIPH